MTSSRETPEAVVAIAAQLTNTQNLIQTLLVELRTTSSGQAALKQELKQLRYNVTILSNIIRGGGDGQSKPLLSEVEILKHADLHLDKRLTACMKDLEEQISDLSVAFAKKAEDLQSKIEQAEQKRAEDVTARFQLQLEEKKDQRLDGRQRFSTWATIIIAVISLIGSLAALYFGKGK